MPTFPSFSAKNRQAVLQSLLTLAREFPEKCNWEEHFKSVLLRLLDLMGDSDTTVKLYSLRVLREMLKTQRERLRDYAELTTLKVLKSFADPDPTVSLPAMMGVCVCVCLCVCERERWFICACIEGEGVWVWVW